MSVRRTGRRTVALLAAAVLALAVTAGVALAAFQNTTSADVTASAADEFPPLAQLVPHFTGTSFGGNTLTVVPGTWTRTVPGTTTTYQWYRCTTASGCATTPVGTGSTYTVPLTDNVALGSSSRVSYTVRETARNVTQSDSALSVPGVPQTRGGLSGTYAGQVGAELVSLVSSPTTMPSVGGSTAAVGSTLTVAPGTWTDTRSSTLGAITNLLSTLLTLGGPTYAYQWLRCGPIGNVASTTLGGAGCTSIDGATSTTYATTGADVGQRLRVRVTRTSATPVLNAAVASGLGITAAVNSASVATVLTQATAVVGP